VRSAPACSLSIAGPADERVEEHTSAEPARSSRHPRHAAARDVAADRLDGDQRRQAGRRDQQHSADVPARLDLAGNFTQLFAQFNFGLLTINSVIVSALVVVLSVGIGGAAAYGFSRYPFTGSTTLLTAILVTRMITPASLVLPLYLMMDELHLTNSLTGITIGITILNLPFAIWLLKPFFDALPREVEEAALLDGLGPIGVWWRIAVPMASPGFKTVALFSFIAAWTDLMIPMTISTRPEGWTLPAGVMQMQTGFKIYWVALMSGGLYRTLPTFLIAGFAQKYLAQGVRASL
jgi:ABC-type glycerol-3-phosphate transport system permease component